MNVENEKLVLFCEFRTAMVLRKKKPKCICGLTYRSDKNNPIPSTTDADQKEMALF
jgi:hypothetical protein